MGGEGLEKAGFYGDTLRHYHDVSHKIWAINQYSFPARKN